MDIVIAGGGIGGLAAALFLHGHGFRARVYEAVPDLREVGVGINIQPHAMRELARIGLLEAIAEAGNSCLNWAMFNRFGQPIWREPRGLAAGQQWPQVSIHRGRLQGILLREVRRRLGDGAVVTGHRLIAFRETGGKVIAEFNDAASGAPVTVVADILIGADGIHSAVRRHFYPNEGDPIFAGALMWRGVSRAKPFFANDTMALAGHAEQKFIVYPITRPDADGLAWLNWIADIHAEKVIRREDWNRQGALEDFAPLYDDWHFPWLDVPGLIRQAGAIYEFPMVDRDPLPRWTFGRVTLLGDAAHPMYPIGANGGSQALRDGSALADAMAKFPDVRDALQAYEDERREVTSRIVRSNRQLGPEQVMQLAHERAPNGFDNIEDVVSRQELEEISARYRAMTWASGTAAAKA